MADNQTPRPYRTTEQTRSSGAAASGSDPLAELARLIGQTDPFGEFGRDDARRAAAASAAPPTNFSGADYFDAPSAPPPPAPPPAYAPPPYARQSSAAGDQFPPPPGHPPGEHAGYEADPYHPGSHQFTHEDEHFYEDATRSKRRMGVLAIAAVFALAVIGTAGAFGYRAIFGKHSSGPPPVIKADATPSKIVPAAASKTPNKLIYDRVSDQSAGEKLVSRQESPVEVKAADIPMAPPLAGARPPGAAQPAPGSGVIATEPKKVHTIAIHPDQLGNVQTAVAAPAPPQPAPPATVPAPRQMASDPPPAASPPPPEAPRMPEPRPGAPPPAHRTASAPPNAPLSLSPNAPAPRPTRTAAATPAAAPTTAPPAHVAGGYSVQVSSQRSEAEAQAAFRSLQAKYPKILGGRHASIHKVELGSKGTYYRALVGPFASANEAGELCNGLRAAGGQCLIQRN